MSDLKELNELLFETLRGVKDGNIDDKRANSIIGLSNSIINNGKLQLNAYKLAKSESAPEIFGLPAKDKIHKENRRKQVEKNRHEAMNSFADYKGYKNVADAMGSMTKTVFMTEFENWLNAEE